MWNRPGLLDTSNFLKPGVDRENTERWQRHAQVAFGRQLGALLLTLAGGVPGVGDPPQPVRVVRVVATEHALTARHHCRLPTRPRRERRRHTGTLWSDVDDAASLLPRLARSSTPTGAFHHHRRRRRRPPVP